MQKVLKSFPQFPQRLTGSFAKDKTSSISPQNNSAKKYFPTQRGSFGTNSDIMKKPPTLETKDSRKIETEINQAVYEKNECDNSLKILDNQLRQLAEKQEQLQQSLVKDELCLIDYQDKHGMLVFDKTGIQKNIDKVNRSLAVIKEKTELLEMRKTINEDEHRELETLRKDSKTDLEAAKYYVEKMTETQTQINSFADAIKTLTSNVVLRKTEIEEISKSVQIFNQARNEAVNKYNRVDKKIANLRAEKNNSIDDQPNTKASPVSVYATNKNNQTANESIVIDDKTKLVFQKLLTLENEQMALKATKRNNWGRKTGSPQKAEQSRGRYQSNFERLEDFASRR